MKLLSLIRTLRMANSVKKFIILSFQRYDFFFSFLFFLLLTFWLCHVNVMFDCEFLIWFLGSILCRDYQKLVSLEKFL